MRKFVLILVALSSSLVRADDWNINAIWHDGLVEKATYTASRPIYGKDRNYEAIIFTNKEQHDLKTLTKASGSNQTVEVWKHNHIEVVPTPNYDYKFETTTHMTADKLELTRLDCSSQEFCGTSFKQFMLRPGEKSLGFFLFSYMPEAGRQDGTIKLGDRKVVPIDSLPLWLRDYDFTGRPVVEFAAIASQKSNRQTNPAVIPAVVQFGGEEGDSYRLDVSVSGKAIGSYWMAKDRLHVMTRAALADGQKYELKKVERVNYWTIKGE